MNMRMIITIKLLDKNGNIINNVQKPYREAVLKQAQATQCAISSGTFKRIYLLTIIGSYKNGVYGLKRLQKITYLSELDSAIKPYSFKRHHFGQYSEELADINNNLIESHFVTSNLLNDSRCCVFSLSTGIDTSYYKELLNKIDPKLVEKIRETIDEFGYLSEDKLLELCYSIPEFKEKSPGDLVLKAEIPDSIEILGLSNEDCENLELTFSPNFINSLSKIVDGIYESEFDIDKVEKIEIQL